MFPSLILPRRLFTWSFSWGWQQSISTSLMFSCSHVMRNVQTLSTPKKKIPKKTNVRMMCLEVSLDFFRSLTGLFPASFLMKRTDFPLSGGVCRLGLDLWAISCIFPPKDE